MLTMPTIRGSPAGSIGPTRAAAVTGLFMGAPADGIRCSPRRTAVPGVSPVGRSPVVLHLNASDGLAPRYGPSPSASRLKDGESVDLRRSSYIVPAWHG